MTREERIRLYQNLDWRKALEDLDPDWVDLVIDNLRQNVGDPGQKDDQ